MYNCNVQYMPKDKNNYTDIQQTIYEMTNSELKGIQANKTKR